MKELKLNTSFFLLFNTPMCCELSTMMDLNFSERQLLRQ